ncbi:MAG: chlorite dismutase family protein [Luteolibacter sp.]
MKKTQTWWALSEEEKREIQGSEPIKTASGLKLFHGIANQLHHSRDLDEPFDFLAWFEYSPDESGMFEEMMASLRASDEWRYVEREVDVRLTKRAG